MVFVYKILNFHFSSSNFSGFLDFASGDLTDSNCLTSPHGGLAIHVVCLHMVASDHLALSPSGITTWRPWPLLRSPTGLMPPRYSLADLSADSHCDGLAMACDGRRAGRCGARLKPPSLQVAPRRPLCWLCQRCDRPRDYLLRRLSLRVIVMRDTFFALSGRPSGGCWDA